MSIDRQIQIIKAQLRLYSVDSKRFIDHLENANTKSLYNIFSTHWRMVIQKYDHVGTPKDSKLYKLIQLMRKRYTEYEDYRIRYVDPGKTSWTKQMHENYSRLFQQLEIPWHYKKERGFYTIRSPYSRTYNYGTIFFRAVKPSELNEAMLALLIVTRKLGLKRKPWKLPFTWNDCWEAYRKRKKNNFTGLGIGKSYDIALMIADNILLTWNGYKKEWTPWNNSWSKLAHQNLAISFDDIPMQPGYSATIENGRINLKEYQRTRKWGFDDITHFVFSRTLAADKKAAWILAVAFTVGGNRAAKLINGFHEQHNLRKWWDK